MLLHFSDIPKFSFLRLGNILNCRLGIMLGLWSLDRWTCLATGKLLLKKLICANTFWRIILRNSSQHCNQMRRLSYHVCFFVLPRLFRSGVQKIGSQNKWVELPCICSLFLQCLILDKDIWHTYTIKCDLASVPLIMLNYKILF